MSHRMHSTIQKSTTQTERQITQRVSNTVQQQRNFTSNQSVQVKLLLGIFYNFLLVNPKIIRLVILVEN